MFGALDPEPVPEVSLVDFDPDGENKLLAAICYAHSHLPESQLLKRVEGLDQAEKVKLITAYVGNRENRRHRPGRAFERTDYRFDVLGDYGAFRDLQRHRLLTIEWQRLTPHHGYVMPELVAEAGVGEQFEEAMARSGALYDSLLPDYPEQAPYAVSMAYRLRYTMQFNAREAIHMLELRSAPQGHPAYRRVVLEMHRLIAQQAGHTAIADAMSEIIDAEDLDPAMLIEVDPDAEVLDADSIGLEGDDDSFELADDLVDDVSLEDVEDPDAIAVATDAIAKKAGDDDDDDDDLRTEDDVEADLDSILKEKLTAADDTPLDDEEEDGVVVDDKTDGMERLQPRRPDEKQCTQCFLLVRNSAPGCPVEDDACPLFK